MVEHVPHGVVSSLITKLASVAYRELGRVYGVMDELQTLRNTIESTRAVLIDAEEKQEKNNAIQNWIKRLKDDVLHPADNLLDEFFIEDIRYKMHKAKKNKVTKVFSSLSPKRIYFRRKMSHEIKKIQKKFNAVVKDMSDLNLISNVVVEQTKSVRKETTSFVFESTIIGRENDRKEIISFLKQPHGSQIVSIIAIVGIGGLGKTTLAQLVYNDAEVTNHFEERMWVCVSNNFEVKTILKKMLELLTKSRPDDTLSFENLQNMLRENLTGKRYLLVLDDIWNESDGKWTQLMNFLMCGAPGSKVVATTRSKTVAQIMSASVPYVLSGLTTELSWDLLKNIITFGDETKEVNRALESIGKKIAEKCIGVPLAIRTLGGLLKSKSEENEWLDVLNGEFWKSCEDEENIMPVLKLSYQNLSPQLRQCFAFCSLFPKDYEIVKDDLVLMWMAQGYLECSDEKQLMEDIGNEFVKIFLMNSFFQDAMVDETGDIFSFMMHDLIHDLAMQVAGNDSYFLDSESKRLVGSPMHLMLELDDIGLLESLDASRMRTLILARNDGESDCESDSENLNESDLSIISKFKHLRLLSLYNWNVSKLCESIEKLNHLRYLKLEFCRGGRSFSESASNLVCLQTLILRACDEIEFSTKDVSNLINLRHFNIASVKGYEEKEKETSGFGKLCLGVHHKAITFWKWLTPLTNIVEISLKYCEGLQYLPPMERLPFLKSLVIGNLKKLEYIYYEEPILPKTFFPSMKYLDIHGCEKLMGWWKMWVDVNGGDNSSQSFDLICFPCLSFLTILNCPMLTSMPTFPNLNKQLYLGDLDILETTLNMVSSRCSIESLPLSMLRHLTLDGIGMNVNKLKNKKNWVQNLTSLEHLIFSNIPNEAFQEIEIWFEDDLNYLPSLQNIQFGNCSDLKALPDWICKLYSLHKVSILGCRNLALLPKRIYCLAKLQTLEIIACPLLIEECETQISVTWHTIAHIPNIILKR